MAAPIAIGMVFQTLYFLVDLYFVAKLGDVAIAGVSAAGSIPFVIMALTQVLGVGTVALVSHAAGRRDQPEANLVFNQSVLLSAICGVLTLVGGYSLSDWYMRSVAADSATAAAGATYLYWYTPGLALQFAQVAMASALRGTGIVKPIMIVQMLTVVLNAVLAPILSRGGARTSRSASPAQGLRARFPSPAASSFCGSISRDLSTTWPCIRRSGARVPGR